MTSGEHHWGWRNRRKAALLFCWLLVLVGTNGFSKVTSQLSRSQIIPSLSSSLTNRCRKCTPEALRSSSKSSSALHMVLTTPESIIEQASTQKIIDDLIDECVRTSARRPIMLQFDPSSNWIWKRWKGTIFAETWDSVIKRMAYATIVLVFCHSFPQVKTWLSGFGILWGQLLSVTTFTLTFFVNQSYALWRKCYELSRRLQGRLHDINLTLAAHAVRKPPANPNEPSTYTAGSRQVLELVSRYVRLFNILTYGSFTRSHRPILTPSGMRRLVERGLMTPKEREVLVDAEIPATQRHTAVLLWIIRTYVEGREAGHFLGGAGFEEQILEKCHVARAQFGAIGDELQGRMPLAYAHIVQVLVDIILWMYPWMAYTSGMSPMIAVIGTGLLTVSYQGLFDLAKQFLDPYDNESYGKGEDPLVVDTLIAETNAGSVRWLNGLEQYPVSFDKMKDGDLSDMMLPVRGYTVEEAEELEAERLRRERERFERKAREEKERLRLEKQAQLLRKAAKAMIPARVSEVPLNEGILSRLDLSVQPDPLADRGLQVTHLPELIHIDTCEAVSELMTYIPNFGNTIAEDILPKGIPLSTEPVPMVIPTFGRIQTKTSNTGALHQDANTDTEINTQVQNFLDDLLDAERQAFTARSESKMQLESMVNDLLNHTSEERTSSANEALPESEPESLESLQKQEEIILTLEEKLETAAILNAPPAADSIEILERKDPTTSTTINATEPLAMQPNVTAEDTVLSAEDGTDTVLFALGDNNATLEIFPLGNMTFDNELSVIDVNEPPSTMDSQESIERVSLSPEEEAAAEKLETEAILNAPPAADSIEILERKDNQAVPLANSTSVDDELAILEMDEPSNSTETEVSDTLWVPNGAWESMDASQVNGSPLGEAWMTEGPTDMTETTEGIPGIPRSIENDDSSDT